MNYRKWAIAAAAVLFTTAARPAVAGADWLFVPFAGLSWRTSAEFVDLAGPWENDYVGQVNFGGSAIWQRSRTLAVEVDFGFAPDLLGDTGDDSDYQYGKSSVS